MKSGVLLPCKKCSYGSTGNSDLDIAFTDHYLTEETLRGFGKVIQCLHKNSEDEAAAFWAFMKHISEYYPEIIFSEIPRQYKAVASTLLEQTELPEVMVEDSPRLDAVDKFSPEAKFMSRVRHHQIQCESCGHLQSFAVWSRMNGLIDPWINGMIASGRLFMNKCRRCGKQQVVPYHTLYLNIEKPFAVWLRMPNSRSEFTIQLPSHDYFQELSPDFTFRAVLSPFELAEKIQIFVDGHDDILVEIIKASLCFQRGIDIVQPPYYVKTTKKLFSGKSMTFALLAHGGVEDISYPLTFQKDKLDQIMSKIQPILSGLPTDWHTVDTDFVIQILQRSGMITRLDI
jgi:hypothetical protein